MQDTEQWASSRVGTVVALEEEVRFSYRRTMQLQCSAPRDAIIVTCAGVLRLLGAASKHPVAHHHARG